MVIMTNKEIKTNDERIILLRKAIEKKRKELKDKPQRFEPHTNCLLVLDKVTYNLHVDSSVYLLIRLNAMVMSAKDLGLDPDKVLISGYSLRTCLHKLKPTQQRLQIGNNTYIFLIKRLDFIVL